MDKLIEVLSTVQSVTTKAAMRALRGRSVLLVHVETSNEADLLPLIHGA